MAMEISTIYNSKTFLMLFVACISIPSTYGYLNYDARCEATAIFRCYENYLNLTQGQPLLTFYNNKTALEKICNSVKVAFMCSNNLVKACTYNEYESFVDILNYMQRQASDVCDEKYTDEEVGYLSCLTTRTLQNLKSCSLDVQIRLAKKRKYRKSTSESCRIFDKYKSCIKDNVKITCGDKASKFIVHNQIERFSQLPLFTKCGYIGSSPRFGISAVTVFSLPLLSYIYS